MASRSDQAKQVDPASKERTVEDLFVLLWETLADILGTAATAILLRRAIKRAISRWPLLAGITIKAERIEYQYRIPDAWQREHSGDGLNSLRAVVAELYPLLTELTGAIVIQRLERVAGLREAGLLPPGSGTA